MPMEAMEICRSAKVRRETSETKVGVEIDLDGSGVVSIDTQCGFLNHMLTLMGAHGLFDLSIKAEGDVEVDFHHLVEDVGICLGQAVDKALSDRAGIRRFSSVQIPMDEALVSEAIDISGRSHLVYNVPLQREKVGDMDTEIIEEFFMGFVRNARVTLHINLIYGKNTHHIIEAIFKGFGRALAEAVSLDTRRTSIPSTKGVL